MYRTLNFLLNFSVILKLLKKKIKPIKNKIPGSFSNRANTGRETVAAWNIHGDSTTLTLWGTSPQDWS